MFIGIGLGQILSLLICGTAVTSGLLDQEGVHIATGECQVSLFADGFALF